MAERKKRKWSKEARERQSIMMKTRFGKTPAEPTIQRNMIPEGILQDTDMAKSDRFISKRTFNYDDDVRFEQGQIVELRGFPNDGKLVSLGFVVPWESRPEWEQECLKCAKVFGSTSAYNAHVASHYDMCNICNKEVPPENMDKHREAHAVLA